MSLETLESVRVKDEPAWDLEDASVGLQAIHEANDAQAGLGDHVVKAEGCESEKEAGVEASCGLYEDHEIKEELVLGPEVFQRPKVTLVCRGPSATSRTCSIRLERMCVDMEHRTCRVGHHTYNFEQYFPNHVETHVDEENSSIKNKPTSQNQDNKKIEHPEITVLRNKNSIQQILHVREKKSYKCDRCSYATAYRNLLKRHELTHTGEKPFKCSYCSHAFIAKRFLKMHERIHTGEKPYKCRYCSYACNQETQLKRHERIHTGEKPYKCTYCSYACSENGRLRMHERTHTGEKPYKCSYTYCSHTCSSKSRLKAHEIIHTGEKPYKCSYCSYTCIHKKQLKDHEKIHTGEKLLNCSHCSYTSSRKENIKTHERIHTGEKPYKCGYCSHTCNKKSNMNSHEKLHTGEKRKDKM